MNQINLNRIITGFLILAVIASSAAYLFSTNNSAPDSEKKIASNEEAYKPLSGKAFVESIPEENLLIDYTSVGDDLNAVIPTIKISPNANLTDALAQHLAAKLLKDNPNGPKVDSTGLLPVPNVQDILDQLSTSGVAADGQLPDWEAEATRLPIIIQENFNQNDLEKYTTTFNQLARRYIGNTNLTTQFKDSSIDPSVALSVFDGLQNDLQKLPAPKSLAGVHWSFMKLVHYQQKALNILIKQDDPMRSALAMESHSAKYELSLALFKEELERANAIEGVALLEESSSFAIKDKIFTLLGIQKAHAIFGVGDVTAIVIENLARAIYEFVKKTAVQFLKERLIKRVIQDTLNWINGGFEGKPKFVTSWRQYLGDAANVLASETIERLAPQLCQPFSAQIRLQLQQAALTENDQPSCSIDEVVQNVRAFYEDFSQGSWVAYGATVLPSGNYFGQLNIAMEKLAQETEKETEAKQSDAIAGSGFIPTEKCTAYEPVCSTQEACLDGIDPWLDWDEFYAAQEICYGPQYACPPNPITNVCTNKETTTAGKILGTSADKSINSIVDQLHSVDGWTALLRAFANAALNRLFVAGVQGVTGLFDDTPGTCVAEEDQAACLVQDVCSEFIGNTEEYASCTGSWQPVNCDAALAPQSVGSISSGQTGTVVNLQASPTSCTGGLTNEPASGTESCEGQCGSGCSCNCGTTAIPVSNFCFADDVISAENAVFADCAAGIDVGIDAPECSKESTVTDVIGRIYTEALAAKLQAAGFQIVRDIDNNEIGEELGLIGQCDQRFCGAGGCVERGTRLENYKIVVTGGTLATEARQPRAICVAP